MKVNGLKHLNSNWYDNIYIRNIKDNIQVDVKNSNKIPLLNSDYSFYDSIKNLSDKEKITEIIKYFLRNNTVNNIRNDYLSNYYGKFVVVEGSRGLYLQLNNEDVDSNVISLILDKYLLDRKIFITNSTMKNIKVSKSHYLGGSSYGTYINEFGNNIEYNYFNLKCKDDILFSYEKEFLLDYMKKLFDATDSYIYAGYCNNDYRFYHYYLRRFGDECGYYIIFDDYKIRLENDLYKIVLDLVWEHNKLLENKDKEMQLSLSYK